MIFSTDVPLRPTLSPRQRRQRLLDDFVPYFLVVFAFWMVCLVEWTQGIAGTHSNPLFWVLMSILVTAYGGCRVFQLVPQLRGCAFRVNNKRAIAEIFARLHASGFVVLHNLPTNKTHSGHVLIGPAGVYAAKIKARAGRGTIEHAPGRGLNFGGRIRDSRALEQARDLAEMVRAQLQIYPEVGVKALLVLTGQWNVRRISGEFDVDVVPAEQLERYLEEQQPELTRPDITEIEQHLKQPTRC